MQHELVKLAVFTKLWYGVYYWNDTCSSIFTVRVTGGRPALWTQEALGTFLVTMLPLWIPYRLRSESCTHTYTNAYNTKNIVVKKRKWRRWNQTMGKETSFPGLPSAAWYFHIKVYGTRFVKPFHYVQSDFSAHEPDSVSALADS